MIAERLRARANAPAIGLVCALMSIGALALASTSARAQDGGTPDGSAPDAGVDAGSMADHLAAAQAAASEASERARVLEVRVVELEERIADVSDRADGLADDLQAQQEASDRASSRAIHFSAYADVGAFWVQGDGSGIRPDTAHLIFPEYSDITDSWVFMGDPLSTAINARGEPADTGTSRAVTFDSVDSRGGASFIVNTLSLGMLAALSEDDDFTANARVDFMPRRRDVSDGSGIALGDYVDVRLAYIEYRTAPSDSFDLSVALGKIDSILGVEYRTQDAPDRMEVTPSLLCRYTCGRPLGARARFRFFEDHAFVVNVAATNGSHFTELFPFSSDVDVNHVITGALRLSYKLPIGSGIEVGISGAVGPQDMQTEDTVVQWHSGVDLLADWDDLYFAAEAIMGKAVGSTAPGDVACGLAPCLEYTAFYGRLGYRFTNWLMPYLRVDFRDALHRDGANFVYISQVLRFTGGVHFDASDHISVKLEYTHNVELGRAPEFDDDVFTSSLVARL